MLWLLIPLALLCLALGILAWEVRRRHMDRWLVPYLCQVPRRRAPRRGEPVHLLLCIADHFEPEFGNPPPEVARARVRRWLEEYPRLFGHFRDSDGRPPRYTFFFPEEEYKPEYLDMLTELCRAGYGEVEVH